MISWMQKHRNYLVITIWISTIAFVGAGFVGWGMYDFNTDRATAMAKVGDIKVSAKEFQTTYSNIYSQYNELVGGTLTQEKAKELKLDELAFKKVLENALFLNYAKKLGILALDKDVIDKLHSIDTFQKNGAFNKDQYYQTLKAVNLSAKEFEDSLKKEIVLEKLFNILSLPKTDLELKTLFGSIFLADKLELKTISIDESKLSIDENEIKKFWENNKNRYMSKTSYILNIIEIPIKHAEVNQKEMQEYYADKKYLFKDDNDKILPFEKAKDRVKLAVQFKKTKKEALKRYLDLKNGKITSQTDIVITEDSTDFPLKKIIDKKSGDFIKPIKLEDHYIVAKLKEIKPPQPMSYFDAKEFAKEDLLIEKRYDALEIEAKKQIDNFQGQDIGFVTRDDVEKFNNLNQDQALQFLNNIFSSDKKRGFYVFKDKAILYKVTDQKLYDDDTFKKNQELLTKNLKSIKTNLIESGLISKLEKEYKIERFYKGQ